MSDSSHHRDGDQVLPTCESCDTGLSRRDFMRDIVAATSAGMFTAGGLGLSRQAFAEEEDPVLRIGYIPIVDAAVLLVAHARGYFEEEG